MVGWTKAVDWNPAWVASLLLILFAAIFTFVCKYNSHRSEKVTSKALNLYLQVCAPTWRHVQKWQGLQEKNLQKIYTLHTAWPKIAFFKLRHFFSRLLPLAQSLLVTFQLTPPSCPTPFTFGHFLDLDLCQVGSRYHQNCYTTVAWQQNKAPNTDKEQLFLTIKLLYNHKVSVFLHF